MILKENLGVPAMTHAGRDGKLFGRSDVSGMAGSRCARATRSGEKSGSGGNEGKFHDLNKLVFVGRQHETHAS